MKKYLYALLLCCCLQFSYAQTFVSIEPLGNLTAAEITSTIFMDFVVAENGVQMYKVLYTTFDAKNQLDTASGFLAIPDSEGPHGWVGYQHGTTDGPQNVPSNLEADFTAAVAYAAFGYISTAADYIGMGESRGFHPYVHDATQARAGIDMLYAVRDYINVSNLTNWNSQLFIAGYSQGGHAAMGMLRELEKNHSDQFPVTAATPMSGPYNLSGVMVDLINQEEPYGTVSYIPYIALGYQEVYGDIYTDLTDIFKPDYVGPIELFQNREIGLGQLNTELAAILISLEGATIPKRMFQDDFYDDFLNNPDNKLLGYLRENDNHNWRSTTPIEIYYCEADEQVPYENSIVARDTMNALGSEDVTAISQGAFLNHGTCALFALPASRDYFNGFLLSYVQQVDALPGISLTPNPANTYLEIKSDDIVQIDRLSIYDTQGRVLLQESGINDSNHIIDVTAYNSGIYYVQMISDNKSAVNKIMIFR